MVPCVTVGGPAGFVEQNGGGPGIRPRQRPIRRLTVPHWPHSRGCYAAPLSFCNRQLGFVLATMALLPRVQGEGNV